MSTPAEDAEGGKGSRRPRKVPRRSDLTRQLQKSLEEFDDPLDAPLVDSSGRFIMSMALMKLLAVAPRAMKAAAMQDMSKMPEIAAKAKAFTLGRLEEHWLASEMLRYMLDGRPSRAVEVVKDALGAQGQGIMHMAADDTNSLGRAIDVTSQVLASSALDSFACEVPEFAAAQQAKVDELERKIEAMQAEVAATKSKVQAAEAVYSTRGEGGWGAPAIRELVRSADVDKDSDMYAYLIQYNMSGWRDEMLRAIPRRDSTS